ncbi:MAG: cellulase family glycosylhydrolase [Clostridia bacterium]|nr:cellulase family glycosylhydrolase [Clostridia bacterium]
MEFILGSNYWASNAGAEMWRDYDIDAIKEDVKQMAYYCMKHIRVFPNWRDFQPVMPLLAGGGEFYKYCLEGQRESTNEYYLDEVMLSRFAEFLDVCKEYNIKVIVGLITGWMSGRMFIPPALYGKNVITDTEAIYLELLFIKGFVSHFKDREEIHSWDLGNECNCMGKVANRLEAATWTAMISNAIRAEDPSRMVVSGMHGLYMDKKWTIQDQGMFTDMLTTHPYPFCGEFTRIDEILSYRTSMYPTCQTKYYSEIGKVPCMAEEIGTFSPIMCSDENAAAFLRLNLLSLWANGACGLMWWCANDQDKLTTFPYSIEMLERELGMFKSDRKTKPVLDEMKRFSEFLDGLSFRLPPAQTDAVCLLSRDQAHWGVAYMTYILARRSGLNIRFAYADEEIPKANLYLLPSVNGINILNKDRYNELLEAVDNGADLYMSLDCGYLSGFESLTGLKPIDSYEYAEAGYTEFAGRRFEFARVRNLMTESAGAQVLAKDNKGYPAISVYNHGKGRVFYVNFPLESGLLDKHDAFNGTHYEDIYKTLFAEYAKAYPICVNDEDMVLTYHDGEDGKYAVILNHSHEKKALDISFAKGFSIDKVIYGNAKSVGAWDGVILKLKTE